MRQRRNVQPNQTNGHFQDAHQPNPNRGAAPNISKPSLRKSRQEKEKEKGFNYALYCKYIFGCIALLVAAYFGYRGYLETRVNTPFDNQKMVANSGLGNPDMFWGSYRPGTYFGLKTRDPQSLVMGLMWYFPRQLLGGGKGIRHWCESGDNLPKYGWTKHDGRTFGIQEIYDGAFKLETSFIKIPGNKNGGEWSARITVTNTSSTMEDISLIWYTALDDKTNGWIKPISGEVTGIGGQTANLGKFILNFDTKGILLT